MNPETNKFEKLHINESLENEFERQVNALLRPNGEPVPKHWSLFQVGEKYVINEYTFECKYVGETSILFEPVGPIVIGEPK